MSDELWPFECTRHGIHPANDGVHPEEFSPMPYDSKVKYHLFAQLRSSFEQAWDADVEPVFRDPDADIHNDSTIYNQVRLNLEIPVKVCQKGVLTKTQLDFMLKKIPYPLVLCYCCFYRRKKDGFRFFAIQPVTLGSIPPHAVALTVAYNSLYILCKEQDESEALTQTTTSVLAVSVQDAMAKIGMEEKFGHLIFHTQLYADADIYVKPVMEKAIKSVCDAVATGGRPKQARR